VRWKQAAPIGAVADMVVRECKASEFADCDVVFSGLDSDVAGDIGRVLPFPPKERKEHT
jgi:aspartate-semialdehyde dehydrogenase